MTGEELAFNEAVRRIEQQEADLAGLHARAAILFSASAIATTFLAGISSSVAGRSVPWYGGLAVILAICSFVGTLVVAGQILWPKEWRFGRSGKAMLESYVDDTEQTWGVEDIYYDLAVHLTHDFEQNRAALRGQLVRLQAGLVLLGAQVLFWLASTIR